MTAPARAATYPAVVLMDDDLLLLMCSLIEHFGLRMVESRDQHGEPFWSVRNTRRPRLVPELGLRELTVLFAVAEGQSNREIAAELGVSPDTVKTQVASVIRKLGAVDRTSAVHRAHQLGIFPNPAELTGGA